MPVVGRARGAARRLQERRRLERLGAQAPLLSQVLAAHLRAGRSLRQAVGESAEHLPEPMRGAVERAAATVALGGAPGEALAGLGDHPDLRLLATAVDMQARFGGDLPTLLEDMSEALHERSAAARAARVATAQARATGRIVSVMPALAVAALWGVDRPAALLLLETWPGWLALGLSAGMTVCGQLLPALGRRPAALAGSRTRVAAAAAGMSAEDVAAFRAGALVVFGTLAVAVLELIGGAGAILPALVTLGVGVVYADVWLRSVDRTRRERIEREAPALLELAAAAVASGVLLDAALAGAGRAVTGPLADELDLARANIGLGHPRRAELLDLAERTGSPSLSGLALAVSLSDRLGVPLADALRRAARRARAERLRVVSERAAAAAPRVLLVVVFLLVPAALIPMAAAIGLSVAGAVTGP